MSWTAAVAHACSAFSASPSAPRAAAGITPLNLRGDALELAPASVVDRQQVARARAARAARRPDPSPARRP